VLGGLSATGFIALEVAQQLIAQGENVPMLVLLDTSRRLPALPMHVTLRLRRALRQFRGFLRLDHARQVESLMLTARRVQMRLLRRFGVPVQQVAAGPPGKRHRIARRLFRLQFIEAYRKASREYSPKTYPGRIAFFLARDSVPSTWQDTRLEWQRLAGGGFDLRVVPGGHTAIVSEPHVRTLAREMAELLDTVQ
jgi:thioesterase domain-containing protein